MAVIMEHEDKIKVEEAAKILSEMMKSEDVQGLPGERKRPLSKDYIY